MVQEWLAAAVGSLMILGSSSAAIMNKKERPLKERIGSTTRQLSSTEIACVGAAVDTREIALASAISANGTAESAAYTARALALSAAYAGTDQKTVRTSVKAAWDTFSASMKAAKKSWQTAREAAWKTYKTAVKACGGTSAQITDTANVASEAAGG